MTPDFRNPNGFGKENVDHINISSRSESFVGRILDLSYYKTLEYPHLGKFSSVMNLWYWLRTDPCHDAFRRATGAKLKKLLQEHNTDHYVCNFKAIIGYATYLKLIEYPHVLREIRELPEEARFVSYYVPLGTKLRVCSNYADVIVPIAEHIRRSLIHYEKPDFTTFAKPDGDCSMVYTGGFLKERMLRP